MLNLLSSKQKRRVEQPRLRVQAPDLRGLRGQAESDSYSVMRRHTSHHRHGTVTLISIADNAQHFMRVNVYKVYSGTPSTDFKRAGHLLFLARIANAVAHVRRGVDETTSDNYS